MTLAPIDVDALAHRALVDRRLLVQLVKDLGDAASAFVYGDGSDGVGAYDGATTVLGMAPSSNVYTLTRDVFLSSGTVSAGVTIKLAGFRIFCTGTFTIAATGVVHNNGNAGGDGTAGGAGAAGAATATASAGGIGAAGGAGGAGNNAGAAGGNSAIGFPGLTGGSGTGGGDGTHTAAAAGTFTALTAAKGGARHLQALIACGVFGSTGLTIFGGGAGGGGGAGDNADAGGGGGGSSGGVAWVAAYNLVNNGAITATGGAGGAGFSTSHNAGGGGGGDGGVVITIARTRSGSGTVTAAGGAGGAKAGASGVAGTAGHVGVTIAATA
jgi:hypothetical protein